MAKINLVKLLESIGFYHYHSGGGCWAMVKDLDEKGNQIWITDNDAGIETLEELRLNKNGDVLLDDAENDLNYQFDGLVIGFFNPEGECYFTLSDRHGLTIIDAITEETE